MELEQREKDLEKILNDTWDLLPKKPTYSEFNRTFGFGNMGISIINLERDNTKLGINADDEEEVNVTTLTILATVTDYLCDKRLGVMVEDRKANGYDDCKVLGFKFICRTKSEPDKIKTGIERIADERNRQIEVEGWTPEHDDEHMDSELALAAACYAVWGYSSNIAESLYPDGWDEEFLKPSDTDIIRNLEKAGALIAAEIDRLQRLRK